MSAGSARPRETTWLVSARMLLVAEFRDSLLVFIVCLINDSKTHKMSLNGEKDATITEKPSVDLSKMTVPQLKALCKERRIPGYSKLGKTALIQTLSEVIPNRAALTPLNIGDGTNVGVPVERSRKQPEVTKVKNQKSGRNKKAPEDRLVEKPAVDSVAPFANSDCVQPAISRLASENTSSASQDVAMSSPGPSDLQMGNLAERDNSSSSTTPHTVIGGPSAQAPSTDQSQIESTILNKRPAVTVIQDQPRQKKARVEHIPCAVLSDTLPSTRLASNTVQPSAPVLTRSSAIPNVTSKVQLLQSSGKRFKPLVIQKPLSVPANPFSMPRCRPSTTSPKTVPPAYLDFPPASLDISCLKTISLPPSLSQRSRVQTWAVILSGLSDEERGKCVLSSRMIRYAVYLSATHILKSKFSGKRLERDTRKVNPAMTNMWPYLRAREAEVSERQAAYKKSFLAKLFPEFSPLCNKLWGSPDHDKQLSIALRFVMTRHWFSVSIGGDRKSDWLSGIVQDVQEVVPQEIWRISVRKPQETHVDVVYVLEATCEAVGCDHSAKEDASKQGNSKKWPLRADWSAYIQMQMGPNRGLQSGSLLHHLKWAHCEEYDKGISKLWLKRIGSEGPLGDAKKTVAERYVLACVVGNSISGGWMATVQMAQEFAGMPSRTDATNTKTREPNLGLFLPGHHHVESVHFTVSKGRALHPALASVQTLHREYFVLRDNGMEVGNEEEGVYATWMNLLQCDSKGLALDL